MFSSKSDKTLPFLSSPASLESTVSSARTFNAIVIQGRIIFSLIKRYLEHKVNYPNATIKKTLILSDLGGGEVILHNNTFCSKIPKEDLSDLLLNTLNYFFYH